jgi:hypothetical protein
VSHTPGPWITDGCYIRHGGPKADPEREVDLARIYCHAEMPEGAYLANARLVAAAPDLYEAALTFCDIWNGKISYTMDSMAAAENALQAAVKKAEGK